MVGTLEYMPPEVLLGHSRATRAADVYAWAVAANALATGTTPPFCDCDRPTAACHTVLEFGYGRQELAAAVAAGGLRPRDASGVRMRVSSHFPSSNHSSSNHSSSNSSSSSSSPRVLVPAPPRFLALVERCWSADPRARPSAEEVARECRLIEDEVVAEEKRLVAEAEEAAKAHSRSNGAAAAREKEGPAPLADGGSAAAALLDGVGIDSSDDDDCEGEEEERRRRREKPWPLPGWARASSNNASLLPPSHASASSYLPKVAAASFEAIGRRESMEDAVLSLSPLYPSFSCEEEGGEAPPTSSSPSTATTPAHLFAVFDGHRGAGAARYAARSLARHLRAVWEGSSSPGEALARAFERVDARWKRREAAALARQGDGSGGGFGVGGGEGSDDDDKRQQQRGGRQGRQRRHCGAAATAALVWGDMLAVANVGDCRGLLAVVEGDGDGGDGGGEGEGDGGGTNGVCGVDDASGNANTGGPGAKTERRPRAPPPPPSWRALRLTADHSADDPLERARVAAEGGTLIPPFPTGGEEKEEEQKPSKGWRLGPVGLAVSRALGDADVAGCSCVPHVSERRLDARCVALILVTDGVTEALEARSGDAAVVGGAFSAAAAVQASTSTATTSNGGGEGQRPTPRSLAVDAEVAALVADTVKEPAMAARRLVVEAVEHRGGKDNAAALVAYLTPVESLERVF